MKSDRP